MFHSFPVLFLLSKCYLEIHIFTRNPLPLWTKLLCATQKFQQMNEIVTDLSYISKLFFFENNSEKGFSFDISPQKVKRVQIEVKVLDSAKLRECFPPSFSLWPFQSKSKKINHLCPLRSLNTSASKHFMFYLYILLQLSYQWSYSLWKSNLKYPNISIFLSPNICVGFYGRSVQLVPKNLENWRETVQRSMLRFEVLCFFSTRQESETALEYIEILKYFLWNNWTVKNGGRWGIQTQIPYWPIYIGIAA